MPTTSKLSTFPPAFSGTLAIASALGILSQRVILARKPLCPAPANVSLTHATNFVLLPTSEQVVDGVVTTIATIIVVAMIVPATIEAMMAMIVMEVVMAVMVMVVVRVMMAMIVMMAMVVVMAMIVVVVVMAMVVMMAIMVMMAMMVGVVVATGGALVCTTTVDKCSHFFGALLLAVG
jgi:hypothetical protein